MGKQFKERTKNVLRRTLFTRVAATDAYALLMSAPLTYDRAKTVYDRVATSLLVKDPLATVQNAKPDFAPTDAQVKEEIGRYNTWLTTNNYFFYDQSYGDMPIVKEITDNILTARVLTYGSYETDRLKHVLDYVPSPLIKKITFKMQLYNPTIVYKLKLGEPKETSMANRRFLFFLKMFDDYATYMRKLAHHMLQCQYVYESGEIGDAIKFPLLKGLMSSDDASKNQFTKLSIKENTMNPVNVVSGGVNQFMNALLPEFTSAPQNALYQYNASKSTNPNLFDYFTTLRKRNYKDFKKECLLHFGRDIRVYDNTVKIKVNNNSKYAYYCFPLMDPIASQFSVIAGVSKYLQTTVTYDTEGCEAALATYSKRIIKNAYVILKDGSRKRRLRFKKKRKYRSKYISMLTKKKYGKKAARKRLRYNKKRRSGLQSKIKPSYYKPYIYSKYSKNY